MIELIINSLMNNMTTQSFVFLSFIIVDGQISNKCDKLMDNTDTVDIYVYIHIYVSVYVEKIS